MPKVYALWVALNDFYGIDFPRMLCREMGANTFERVLQNIVDDYGLNIDELISRKEYGNGTQQK